MELLNWAKKVSRKARLHLDLRAQCQRALVLFPSHIYSNVAFFCLEFKCSQELRFT